MIAAPRREGRVDRADLPLACRLPNPPALFLGRASEIKWLRDAVLRAPVTVIEGEGGLGKSALTLFLLHSRFPERIPSTVFVSLRGGDPHEPVALTAARTLVRADGIRHFDWSELISAPDALGTLAIDLADGRERWVVLDDLHLGDAGEVRAFLRHVSRYARRSRWIATTREAGGVSELAGQVLHLGAMKSADLQRIARALDPSSTPEAIRRAVEHAEGSPWRLRQVQTAGSSAPPRAPEDLLGGLTGETLTFLKALTLLSVPLPDGAIERVAPRPTEPLAALELRGLLERTGQGVRIHELTRDLIPKPDDSSFWKDWRAQAGRSLAASTDAAQRLEAARILLDARRPAEVADLLAGAGEDLVNQGYAARLWKLLEPTADPRLEHWRLRCAVELGDADVLGSVQRPEGSAPELLFLWARLLLTKGEMAAAAALSEQVQIAADRAGDGDLACRAGILRARSLANDGRVEEGLRLLEDLVAPDAISAAQRDAQRAVMLSFLGLRARALECAAALWRAVPDLPWPVRSHVGFGVARAFYYLGRLRDASRAFDSALENEQHGSLRFDAGRAIRHVRACLWMDSGDFPRARREIESLEPYLPRSSLLRPYIATTKAYLSLSEGDFEELDRMSAELSQGGSLAQVGNPMRAVAMHARVIRRAPWSPPEDGEAPLLASPAGRIIRPHRIQIDLRAGRISPDAALSALDERDEYPESRLVARTVRAEARIIAGDAEAGLAEGTATIADAEEHGYGILEVEARQVVCDALLCLGKVEDLARAAADLAARARSFSSARFARTAAFYEAIAAPSAIDPGAIEALAAAIMTAPDIAIRARALLGADAPLDALDRVVLEAVPRHTRWRTPALLTRTGTGDGRWTPGWGLDTARERAWLPDGRAVDLSRHPVQWRLLSGLADRGGRATKEQLVLAVWGERDYHPLRHDNRLQAAVRKLRGQIEDDPSAPARVVTESDGYAISGVARRI